MYTLMRQHNISTGAKNKQILTWFDSMYTQYQKDKIIATLFALIFLCFGCA